MAGVQGQIDQVVTIGFPGRPLCSKGGRKAITNSAEDLRLPCGPTAVDDHHAPSGETAGRACQIDRRTLDLL